MANKGKKLPRPSAYGTGQGFIAPGMGPSEAFALGRRCGRSLDILKRLQPTSNEPLPDWLDQVRLLKPAFLAGAWSAINPGGNAVVAALNGTKDVSELEATLNAAMDLQDRPMEHVGEVWAVRSPVDAFFFYASQVHSADPQRLREAIPAFSAWPKRTLCQRRTKLRMPPSNRRTVPACGMG